VEIASALTRAWSPPQQATVKQVFMEVLAHTLVQITVPNLDVPLTDTAMTLISFWNRHLPVIVTQVFMG